MRTLGSTMNGCFFALVNCFKHKWRHLIFVAVSNNIPHYSLFYTLDFNISQKTELWLFLHAYRACTFLFLKLKTKNFTSVTNLWWVGSFLKSCFTPDNIQNPNWYHPILLYLVNYIKTHSEVEVVLNKIHTISKVLQQF